MNNVIINLRKIAKADMTDVVEILQQLSIFKPPKNQYQKIWNKFSKQKNLHSLVATIDNKIVGYGSIVIETKIRGGKTGHIEDIVSHRNYKKRDIGRSIVNGLFDIAKKKGCYKVVLQCKANNKDFYKKCHYKLSGIAMQRFTKILK